MAIAVPLALMVALAALLRPVLRASAERRLRAAATGGYLPVAVRSLDGHPHLARRWWRAEIRLEQPVRISPLAGPSAVPLLVTPTSVRLSRDGLTWRDLSADSLVGGAELVEIADADGTIQVAVPTAFVPWLLDGLEKLAVGSTHLP